MKNDKLVKKKKCMKPIYMHIYTKIKCLKSNIYKEFLMYENGASFKIH